MCLIKKAWAKLYNNGISKKEIIGVFVVGFILGAIII